MENSTEMRPSIDQTDLARRAFLKANAAGLGGMALGALLGETARASATGAITQFAPTAKRVVCLFQSGGLSHIDLFDNKPTLEKFHGEELPPAVKGTQRVTGMTSGQSAFKVAKPLREGKVCGDSGRWVSNLLPYTQTIVDQICVVKTVHTEAINHDPAITMFNTGNQQPGYPSMGAWASYGLGSENHNLPTFVTMVSQGSGKNPGQPIFSRLWGSGFLPSSHQGVGLRPGASPVLYLQNPEGVEPAARRELLDHLGQLNQLHADRSGDPETITRLNAYEMAFRMQTSVPELTDLREESAAVIESYGPQVHTPGSYAANCLLARRMLERGVRFVQLFHRGWDQHIALAQQLPRQCDDVDQPTAALVRDLDQRGLLEDTLVLFATEFGRTTYTQGALGSPSAGRDHHGRCFTIWMAGGGVKPGIEYGVTDDFCYNIVDKPVHVRDVHATLLKCLGFDHQRFKYRFRGLDVGLTGVEEAHVVDDILA